MKAPAFEYARPRTLPEAFALLARYGEDARVLAGGQSLMATLNMRLSSPRMLVDINDIEGLSGIAVNGGWLRIGALTRHAEVERDPLVARHAPLIAKAMPHVAHAAIRNRGTFGGSLAFADPAAELPACVVALDGRLLVQGAGGARVVAAGEFFHGMYRTALAPGEIVVACELPVATARSRQAFAELARRHGDYAVVGVAANVEMLDGRFAAARLAYCAAGDRPVLAAAACAALVGRPNSPEVRQAALAELARDLDPPSDLNADAAMRLHLARVLTRRLLEELQ